MSASTPSKQQKEEKTTETKLRKKRNPERKYCFVCKSDTQGSRDCKDIVIDSEEELKESLNKLTFD